MRRPRFHHLPGLLAAALSTAACATATAPGQGDDSPDARPLAVDAGPDDVDARIDAAVPIDAMPAPPDATACTVQQVQLLANPSFDVGVGAPWVENQFNAGFPLVTNDLPVGEHTQPNGVWLAGFDSVTHSIYQDVAIPAGATGLALQGQRWIATAEFLGLAFDFSRVQIRTTGNVVLDQLQFSNLDSTSAWTPFALSPTGNHAGQTLRVYLEATTDGSDNTNFYYDTFTLAATVCL